MRAPGSTMPARFNGSAAATCNVISEGVRRMDRRRSTASGRANCSPRKPDTKRPPRISPRASMRRSAIKRSRHAGASASRARRSRKIRPHRSRSWRAKASARSSEDGAVCGRSSNAQRPAACLGIFKRELPSPRRRFGSIRARRFSKPSAVTSPAAASSQSASSTWLVSCPVALTNSGRNEAPRRSSASAISRADCDNPFFWGGESRSHDASSRRNIATGATRVGRMRRFLRLASSSNKDGCGDKRPHITSPDRQRRSSRSGVYRATRRRNTSDSQPAAEISYP